ncbi:MAG: FAD-dependent thymidylate synthase [Chloroflexota bacterium]|nr:FAD-dependent thymidylate synthase [Chloroflexota bacterium]
MADNNNTFKRRVYPLDAHNLTEEQIAVAFAMTSRRPEPFDEIADQVSKEKAADFHERWVLGYGHASVAEHAVVHLALENVSRLACDALEDNRLASYTEKSSRYQVLDKGSYYFPKELLNERELAGKYSLACDELFDLYSRLIDGSIDYLRTIYPQREKERGTAYALRLRREATDTCRSVLPASTLTNVGITANARVLEHAISKLMSGSLTEEREVGLEIREQSRTITPTLIKYAEENTYLKSVAQNKWGDDTFRSTASKRGPLDSPVTASLISWDENAESKLATALLYSRSSETYAQVSSRVSSMTDKEIDAVISSSIVAIGAHDAPTREFEMVNYTFEFLMDYGAYREYKRHRMQSYIPQVLTVQNGYRTLELIEQSGLNPIYEETLDRVDRVYTDLESWSPIVAQYLVTHGHYCRILAQMNLRECYHLFKLRSADLAHFSIREPILEALKLVVDLHPRLFKHIQLKDYPDWWPFKK